jgi:hypothetical protein
MSRCRCIDVHIGFVQAFVKEVSSWMQGTKILHVLTQKIFFWQAFKGTVQRDGSGLWIYKYAIKR